jgi:AraC family transcriptional regulator
MMNVRVLKAPGFIIAGRFAWIEGPDNMAFGRFWEQCRENGLLRQLDALRINSGLLTKTTLDGAILGVSCVENDPTNRSFDYWIATACGQGPLEEYEAITAGLNRREVPSAHWAVFSCPENTPAGIVQAEMYAFGEWLPRSGFRHANAPEMEVYPSNPQAAWEFWLPLDQGPA